MQGRVSVLVLLRDPALGGDEDAGDAGVAVAGRRVQRRVAILERYMLRS